MGNPETTAIGNSLGFGRNLLEIRHKLDKNMEESVTSSEDFIFLLHTKSTGNHISWGVQSS